MLNKKKITKPTKHDEAALSAAMKELSKQTEALLGSPEPKKAPPAKKPHLPKKQSLPKSRGKSFDIISQSKQPRKLKATLKTVEPKLLKPLQTTSPKQQISDRISKKSTSATVVKKARPSATSSRPTVAPTIVHQKGRLQLQSQSAEDDQASIVTNEPKEAPSVSVARTGIVFSEDDTPELITQTPPEVDTFDSSGADIITEEADDSNDWIGELSSHTKSQNSAEQEDSQVAAKVNEKDSIKSTKKADTQTEPTVYRSGELYANNLVKAKKPKGYQPLTSQQKPTVFDTNEYHVELHDWSKLDHSANGRWILLLLLVAVLLGVFVYAFVLKQPIPFIGAA
ncbi:hypothetical protein KA021_01810 [Candidatus Saccharibacteria bacterium]|jgi:hypothetical protein|nr:hypothetical protein [Candidatus Saccharibacteria bacterium]